MLLGILVPLAVIGFIRCEYAAVQPEPAVEDFWGRPLLGENAGIVGAARLCTAGDVTG